MGARFVYRPLSAEQMSNIGQAVIDKAIKPRIAKGINADDAPAKPLKPGRNGRKGYPEWKTSHGLAPIRDLVRRGLTMRSLKVVDATANQVRIGFSNPEASRIAAINNRRDPAFWFSPSDKRVIQQEVNAGLNEGRNLSVGRAS